MTSSLATHGSWGPRAGGEERGSGGWDTCSTGRWIRGRRFALGILFFLIFLILGQVLVLTIAQEGEGLCLCSEMRVYLGEG